MSTVTLNQDQRLFVLQQAQSVSCLGFDVVYKRLRQYAQKLGLAQPREADIGTMAQYRAYQEAERAYIATKPNETLFDPETPPGVQALLETYRQNRRRLRIFYGDAQTGRDWLQEHDVIGTVSRSTGPIKVALLVPAGERGGPALLTQCIVRMLDVASKQEIYRHRAYHRPSFELVPGDEPGYVRTVKVDGEVHARFETDAAARNWVAFMDGSRMKH